MARRKSISDLDQQRTRIMLRAARQYGYSERQRSIRDKVKSTSERYKSNIFRHFGADTIAPSKVSQKVPRRVYMGLSNG